MALSYEKDRYLTNNPWAMRGLTNPSSTLNPPTPEVTSSLKPIDREDANLEVEKSEVALSAAGSLYKIRGKSHAQGGTPVNLPEGSFIYSNHKPLAIDKNDKELFQFKEGGKYKPKNNTPAKIVEREVNIEHHNKMIAIGKDDKFDHISKKSAKLMLQKNFSKLGQVAYLQEEKKGFPDGLPGVSDGTAPVMNEQLQEQTNVQKQYQMGGSTPSLPWMNNYDPVKAPAQPKFCPPGIDCHPSRRKLLTPPQSNILPPVTVVSRPHHFPGGDITTVPHAPLPPATIDPSRGPGLTIPTPANPYTPPEQGTPDEEILPYKPRVPLSPDQLMNLGYDAYNAASVKQFYPKREQLSFTPVNLERVNAQPYLNEIGNSTAEAYRANQAFDPIQARAQNSQIFGKSLEQRSQVLGNVQNQNAQIGNQEAMYNNQGANNTAAQNVNLDSKYYDQTQALAQNFDNEKRYAWNNVVSQYNQFKSQNDSLQMQLASQPTYGSVDVWQDPHTGRTSRTPVQGWLKKQQAAPLYDYNAKDNSIYFTGAGMSMDQLPNQTNGFSYEQMKNYATDLGLDAKGKAYLLSSWLKQSNPFANKR